MQKECNGNEQSSERSELAPPHSFSNGRIFAHRSLKLCASPNTLFTRIAYPPAAGIGSESRSAASFANPAPPARGATWNWNLFCPDLTSITCWELGVVESESLGCGLRLEIEMGARFAAALGVPSAPGTKPCLPRGEVGGIPEVEGGRMV
jgi:hypothetical protein